MKDKAVSCLQQAFEYVATYLGSSLTVSIACGGV
jgi:hypothetical protein